MSNTGQKTRAYVAFVVAVGASVAAGMLVWWGLDVRTGPGQPADDPGSSRHLFRAFDDHRGGPNSTGPNSTGPNTSGSMAARAAADPSGSADSTTRAGDAPDDHRRAGTVVRPDVSPAAAPADGGVDAGDSPRWNDPVNQRVLGNPNWMADVPDATSQAVEAALDAPPPQPYPYDLDVRRRGIELAAGIVDDCLSRLRRRQPSAAGRIIVAFDLVADGQRARFWDVELPANIDLKDPGFERCIHSALSSASFGTAESGVMHVAYPIFLDL